jgi:hypothetical protein
VQPKWLQKKKSNLLGGKNMEFLFEEFLEYCGEDNQKLKKDIKTYLADFFDISHRSIPLSKKEKEWIKSNISPGEQLEIFGKEV